MGNNYEYVESLKGKVDAYEEIVKKFGSIKNALDAIPEEEVLKFYYCESEDKYLVGMRVDTMYYAEITKMGDLSFFMSRYLPWGKHVVAPHTAWKEYTYPSEPKELFFPEWLKGLMKQQGWNWS